MVGPWGLEVGQVAGTSGDCAAFNPITQDYLRPLHALLWEDQKITDLGTLGGTGPGFGILADNPNNRGQGIGWSDLACKAKFHAFLWTRETVMQHLGTA